MFWGPSVWAGLRAGDAGNAEEELGCNKTRQRYTLRVGLPTQRSWISNEATRLGPQVKHSDLLA